jgi:hypothetical protein
MFSYKIEDGHIFIFQFVIRPCIGLRDSRIANYTLQNFESGVYWKPQISSPVISYKISGSSGSLDERYKHISFIIFINNQNFAEFKDLTVTRK